MASFAIHCVPMIVTLCVRWYIIPSEENLPEDERVFCSITHEELFDSFFWKTMLFNNLKFYCVWMVPYFITNFVIFGKFIFKYKYNTLYTYFFEIEWSRKTLTSLGPIIAPIGFMFHHFLFYFFSNILGVISFYNFYFGHFIAAVFFTVTV